MSDLINGREMMQRLHGDICSDIACTYCSMRTKDGGCRLEDWIDEFPSADRPQREWAKDPINENIRQCSNCKASYTKDFLKSMTLYVEPKEVPNYCPNCGAKMKGADDEEMDVL